MSARIPDPTRETVLDALLVVGMFAEALGVELATPPAGRGGDTKTSSSQRHAAHPLQSA